MTIFMVLILFEDEQSKTHTFNKSITMCLESKQKFKVMWLIKASVLEFIIGNHELQDATHQHLKNKNINISIFN